MKKPKMYLYPKVFPCENPYVINLEDSLSPYFEIVNKGSNPYGVLDLFRYLFRVKIYYFNWIENLPSKRFGPFQVMVFSLFLFLAACFRKKIIWTLHNKYSHDKNDSRWVDFMFRTMFRHAAFIPTHSEAGVEFAKENYPRHSGKVKYFIHPVNRLFNEGNEKKPEYDLFIWGTIWFYKGVTEFLKFLKETSTTDVRVLIAGKCINGKVKAELDLWLTPSVVHLNDFYEIEDIAAFSATSRFTVFLYKPDSILSSGSLMDSIGMRSVIIGPAAGAFKDLAIYGFVKTYSSFTDIISICRESVNESPETGQSIEEFCRENGWNRLGSELYMTAMAILGLSTEKR